MKYSAKGTHNRHFELTDEANTALGKLDYTSWFSIKSELTLTDGSVYHIAPSGFLHTAVTLSKGEETIATLKFNWKGQIVLNMPGDKNYVFKKVGIFSGHFGLFNELDHELITLKQHFKLAVLSFNYTIDTDDNYPEANDPVIIMLLIYCANYIHMMASSAV